MVASMGSVENSNFRSMKASEQAKAYALGSGTLSSATPLPDVFQSDLAAWLQEAAKDENIGLIVETVSDAAGLTVAGVRDMKLAPEVRANSTGRAFHRHANSIRRPVRGAAA
jgi:hypothetical protein